MDKLSSKALVLFILQSALISILLFTFIAVPFLAIADAGMGVVILTFLGMVGLGVLWGHLTYQNFTYTVDVTGITIEKGVINKKKVIIPYGNIQNIDMPRNLFDRILGLSHLKVQTAGDPKIHEGVIPALDKKVAEDLQKDILGHVNK